MEYQCISYIYTQSANLVGPLDEGRIYSGNWI